MQILAWIPAQPRKITAKIMRSMDRLIAEFKRQHGRRPRSGICHLSADGLYVERIEFEPEEVTA